MSDCFMRFPSRGNPATQPSLEMAYHEVQYFYRTDCSLLLHCMSCIARYGPSVRVQHLTLRINRSFQEDYAKSISPSKSVLRARSTYKSAYCTVLGFTGRHWILRCTRYTCDHVTYFGVRSFFMIDRETRNRSNELCLRYSLHMRGHNMHTSPIHTSIWCLVVPCRMCSSTQ